ncbi:hypothetical protein DPM13_15890 [Paracoccus mutanolyticus]|uniref:Uncharacterized protein n=1 Tax=Paracoccus mutanolyticus TaxID=1499308 RepID=A0ABM6WTE7_9RHOB|nr:hypothetical protein [Paracoccus mutanolyticus]AWX93950.1 hypothetical protein DPM13_15890 [Paracoccus mutanolyticus]
MLAKPFGILPGASLLADQALEAVVDANMRRSPEPTADQVQEAEAIMIATHAATARHPRLRRDSSRSIRI